MFRCSVDVVSLQYVIRKRIVTWLSVQFLARCSTEYMQLFKISRLHLWLLKSVKWPSAPIGLLQVLCHSQIVSNWLNTFSFNITNLSPSVLLQVYALHISPKPYHHVCPLNSTKAKLIVNFLLATFPGLFKRAPIFRTGLWARLTFENDSKQQNDTLLVTISRKDNGQPSIVVSRLSYWEFLPPLAWCFEHWDSDGESPTPWERGWGRVPQQKWACWLLGLVSGTVHYHLYTVVYFHQNRQSHYFHLLRVRYH